MKEDLTDADSDSKDKMIALTTKEGKKILIINIEKKLAFVYTSGIEEVHEVYFEHMELFALELWRATGHDVNPNIL